MSKINKKYIALAAAIICVLICSIIFFRYLDRYGSEELVLDQKVEMLVVNYGIKEADILSRSGGYDAAAGQYHYEFTWNKGSEIVYIIYDGPEDMSKDTLDCLYEEKMK